MAKLISFKSLLANELENPEFAAEFHKTYSALEFALSLTLLREARGLTQRALEELTGIKQPMLARIEKGQIPSTPTLQKLAKALAGEIRISPDGRMRIEPVEALEKAA